MSEWAEHIPAASGVIVDKHIPLSEFEAETLLGPTIAVAYFEGWAENNRAKDSKSGVRIDSLESIWTSTDAKEEVIHWAPIEQQGSVNLGQEDAKVHSKALQTPFSRADSNIDDPLDRG